MNSRHLFCVLTSITVLELTSTARPQPDCQAVLDRSFGAPGMNFEVRTVAVLDTGQGPALYAGGDFTTAGGVSATYVAKWDGVAWSSLGNNLNGQVFALAVFDDGTGPALFAGGYFTMAGATTVNYIAKWNGNAWVPLGGVGSGPGGPVYALAVFNGELYAGGDFSFSGDGSVILREVAKWNGNAWSGLGGGVNRFQNPVAVYALHTFDDGTGPALYVGGVFDRVYDTPDAAVAITARHIARWKNNAWSGLGGGVNYPEDPPVIYTLTDYNDGTGSALYAGGHFSLAYQDVGATVSIIVRHIARWDGTSWSGLGGGVNYPNNSVGVFALTVFDNGSGSTLYAGGQFDRAYQDEAANIVVNVESFAAWDGIMWSAPREGRYLNDWINALVGTNSVPPIGPALYAVGRFTSIESPPVLSNHIARWMDPCPPPANDIVWDPATNPTPWPNNNPLATTRSLAFKVTGPAMPSKMDAIKVCMVDLQNPVPPNAPQFPPQNFSAYETATCTAAGEQNGCCRWVGPWVTVYESQGPPLAGPSIAARLQCTPYYWDWKSKGPIWVVGAEIMPSSQYSVQAYAASCMGNEATCTNVSVPVTMYTRRSGDMEAPYNPPTNVPQPDAIDLAQVVNKFGGKVGAPVKCRAQLQPNLPELNTDVNALDIVAVVDAIKGKAYPFPGPCPCPSLMLCRNTPCATPAVCVALPPASGGGAGAMCVKTCDGGSADGQPCINIAHCPGGTACGAGGPTPGFCRDKCGRCNKP